MKKLLLFILLIYIKQLNAQVITTLAGTGVSGYSGDGGYAGSAKISSARGVATDSKGNIYISDGFNYRIRKVNKHTRIITTIAGTGISGYSGDGGNALSAKISGSMGIDVDANGNIYFVDNQRIRKIDTTGIITTVAGTGVAGYNGDSILAINAQLNYPVAVTADLSGNLYISDFSNQLIRKVDAGTGIITTIAGNGTQGYSGDGGLAINAELSNPAKVRISTSGIIYIADYGNSLIRKIDNAGIITTIAGGGTQSINTVGPATSANLYGPWGLAFDNAGNYYFADSGNGVIRQVNASGIISIYAGRVIGGYTGDGGLATNAEIDVPYEVAIDTAGYLYFADSGNNAIRKVSMDSCYINVFASSTICNGSTAFISASGATTYTCMPGGATGSNINVTPTSTTVYTITGTSNTCLGASTVTVTVKPTPSVSFSTTPNATPHVWDATVIYSGGTPPYTYNWNWGDGSSNTTTAYPSHTYTTAGWYNICATMYDASGCAANYCQNDSLYKTNSNSSIVTINVSNSSFGIFLNTTNNDILLYPNPTVGQFTIATNTTDRLTVDLYDVNGRHVLNKIVVTATDIDASNLDNGIYTLTIKSNLNIINKKIVIAR